ncbi:hypothetical protein [Roseateles sp. BYS96W]|uniref:Toxin CptA n=1 Tax=Pelomonas nitida TaxID=3299027 RepID=A0ABW7G4T5_9BURK
MRRTPPVVVQLQPQRVLRAVVTGIAGLAAAGLTAWLLSHHAPAWPLLLAIPFVVIHAWRSAEVLPRRLRWDGQSWWLAEPGQSAEAEVQLDVLIDLDAWLLLRAAPGPRWLPLARRQQVAHWGALRATLFSAPAATLSR